MVAGEVSGDNLGAGLIEALRERLPRAQFAGMAGARMKAAGCECWESSDSLAVMGLFEVLAHLPRLLRLRRSLHRRLLDWRPDVFIGIDAPEFNLGLAAKLRARGIPAVQYVSPQVWAWRQGRVQTIGRAVDLVLCLLPFEQRFYDEHGVAARFVGHPLADQIPLAIDRAAAREALSLPRYGRCLAVLPGSRRGEVARLAGDFAATIAWIARRRSDVSFVAPMAGPQARTLFEQALARAEVLERVRLIDGQAQTAMAASDAVLLASGTATLEATLVGRPMVVAYRLGRLTSFLLRGLRMMKAPHFAQPNLLAGRRIVPEFFNEEVRADRLGPAVLEQLERADRVELERTFAAIHRELRRNASAEAAKAVVELLTSARDGTEAR